MDKYQFGVVVMVICASLIIMAMFTGHNGAFVGTLTGLIGAVVGSILGFEVARKTAKP